MVKDVHCKSVLSPFSVCPHPFLSLSPPPLPLPTSHPPHLLYLFLIWLHQLGVSRSFLGYHGLQRSVHHLVFSLAHLGKNVILHFARRVQLKWHHC